MRAGLAQFVSMISRRISRLRREWVHQQDVWVVRRVPDAIETEPVCANCLQTATSKRREASPSGATTLFVFYCGACLEALGRRNVRQLAWVLATVLLGIASSVFFPLMPWLSQGAALSGALVFAALPWLLGQMWLRRKSSPLPWLNPVSVSSDGVVCTNQAWAQRLAHRLDCDVIQRRVHWRFITGWSITGLVIAAVATPVLYDLFHCETRILNLTEEEIAVWVDGRRVALVKATSQENPLAGVVVRIAMGSRHLEARRHDGTRVHDDMVRVAAGQSYLYAPAHPADTCFWIEKTSLGRARAASPDREYLPQHADFWKMPISIDTWFIPASGSESEFFTGGVVTSLRQGPCSRPGLDSGAHF